MTTEQKIIRAKVGLLEFAKRQRQPSLRNDGLQSRRFLPRFYPGSGPAGATMRSRPSHTFVGSGANNEIRRG